MQTGFCSIKQIQIISIIEQIYVPIFNTLVTLYIYFYCICLRIIPGNGSNLNGKSKVTSSLDEHVFYFTKLVMDIIKYLLSPPRKQAFAQGLLGFTLNNKNNHCAIHLPLVMAKHLETGNCEMLHFHRHFHILFFFLRVTAYLYCLQLLYHH